MKITPNQKPPPPPAPAIPVLRRKNPSHRKQSRRKPAARTPRFQSGKRAGPPTPLPQCKFDNVSAAGGERLEAEVDEFAGRRVRRGANAGGGTVSVRKLAAALWRLQPPEAGQERRRSSKGGDRLGFKRGTSHVGEHVSSHDRIRGFGFEPKGQPRSPCSVNGPVNGYTCEPQASFRLSNYAMEGATKWDPVRPEKNEDPESFQLLDNKQNAVPKVSALQAELEQAQRRIEELESERRSSKKKLKQFLLKLNEERTGWRSREHEKVRAIISDVKADLTRERKNCQRLEMINSKLVNDVAETKSVMKRYMQEFEKERKNRELVEEVCDELAKEMEEDKAEVEELKAECVKIREEVDDERKMLQMAEVWREERVQMKLVDAKVSLENKYSEMNSLVEYLQRFLGSNGGDLDPELLHRASSSSVKIEEFTYVPPKSDDIFAIFEEMGMGETSEREIEPCNEDRSGGETGDDHGSSVSPEGSVTSMKNSGSGTETSEVCSLNLKKRSLPNNGDGYKIVSVDGTNGGRLWSSPESGNHPHIGKGMKGCIEWPRGQKQSFKSKLLESQKIQLRQVLKHKI